MPSQLPRPDEFGNYWLDRSHKNIASVPAIFPCKRIRDGEVISTGEFFLSLGDDGVCFQRTETGSKIRTWESPQQAFNFYRKRMARKAA